MSNPPLQGLKVLDLSQHAPGPFATMMLGDLGAEVIHVSHPAAASGPAYFRQVLEDPFMGMRFTPTDMLMRNKRSIQLDLKMPEGRDICRALAVQSDVMVVEMRPGKLARLGLGHDSLKDENPGLISCYISGYGGTGPRAQEAGHDLNYTALTGALELFQQETGEPRPPQNILADYAGGGYLAVIGILAALAARTASGLGQEIDVGMLDGALFTLADLLSAPLNGIGDAARWRETLGGGMPNYRCYACADGRYLAVAALEKRFFETLLRELDLLPLMEEMDDAANNTRVAGMLAGKFAQAPRDHWLRLFAGKEVCVTPVLKASEVPDEPQVRARGLVTDCFGLRQLAPVPRFSRTPAAITSPPPVLGSDTRDVLGGLGYDEAAITALAAKGAIGVDD